MKKHMTRNVILMAVLDVALGIVLSLYIASTVSYTHLDVYKRQLPAYLFAGLPPHYTYATNKFSAACGTTFATASFFKNGAMNVKVGILAAIGSFAGSALGAHIVLLLSDEVLKTTMFIILPIAAVIIPVSYTHLDVYKRQEMAGR